MKRKRNEQLEAGQFRLLNEMLYTSQSSESLEMFSKDPQFFQVYHRGFAGQIASWPVNPLMVVEEEVRKIALSTNESLILADLGCGLGQLEINLKDLKHLKVLSYDLVSSQEHVVACDISKLPLRKRKLDIAVFCLSLMGTNHVDMVKEAHRVLKPKATLIIAEVSSRFTLPDLLENMKLLGFKILKKHIPNTYFSVLLFRKVKPKANSITELFSPCKYKKR